MNWKSNTGKMSQWKMMKQGEEVLPPPGKFSAAAHGWAIY